MGAIGFGLEQGERDSRGGVRRTTSGELRPTERGGMGGEGRESRALGRVGRACVRVWTGVQTGREAPCLEMKVRRKRTRVPRAIEMTSPARLHPHDIRAIAQEVAALLEPAGPPPRPWLSVDEVADAFGRSREWVRDHAEELGGRKIGGRRAPWSFPASGIDAAPPTPSADEPRKAKPNRRKQPSAVALLPIRGRS